jgi:hypothetical protein
MKNQSAVTLAFGLLLAASACGSGSQAAQTSPSAQASASQSPSQSAQCTSSGAGSTAWPDPSSAQPGRVVSAVANGNTLTLTFNQGTPQFDVTPQPTAQFTADASGQSVTLGGNAGVLIRLRGFQTTAQGNLGPITTSSLGPELADVRKIGDFEGVVSIGAGLQSAGCAVVVAGTSSLTFTFQAQPPAGG